MSFNFLENGRRFDADKGKGGASGAAEDPVADGSYIGKAYEAGVSPLAWLFGARNKEDQAILKSVAAFGEKVGKALSDKIS